MDIKQEVEQSGTVNPEYIKLENEDPDYGVQCHSLQVGELDKSSLDIPKHEDIWLGMKKEASEADSKKHEKAVDINPVQLTGESDSKIESSMTTDVTYESVLQRIKAEHIEENWDEEDLSVNIEQIKKEQHPAVAIKCEKSEEPDMDNVKTENMDISELNEELDIKPDDEAALSSDSAARITTILSLHILFCRI
ncbi:unnamed protein product [Callosobruchus maculatus]|uniref:Uncharacterized protein n=1 Tax=Callosobruchus maculatus TaxID=64391 RepID=A0A653D9H4_CALMS|nr:unnamed protein product [Callosobruchus maculatus]